MAKIWQKYGRFMAELWQNYGKNMAQFSGRERIKNPQNFYKFYTFKKIFIFDKIYLNIKY